MADKTGIEWTDASWNPVVGCSIVSPGCTNCYAMAMAGRIERMGGAPHYAGTTQASKAGSVWTGKLALAPDSILTQPLRWKRGRRIFVNSMGDLFHEDVPDAWIDRVFAVMALTPQHNYQILTKRSARMRAYLSDPRVIGRIARVLLDAVIEGSVPTSDMTKPSWPVISIGADIDEPDDLGLRPWPLANVWLGVSAEDQRRADERIPDLLATPAAVRFVSAEPLLGPIDFTKLNLLRYFKVENPLDPNWPRNTFDALRGRSDIHPIHNAEPAWEKLDWIIVGGESGRNARPMHPDWARSIRDQCAAAGTAFFFKQWGEWSPHTAALEDESGSIRTSPRGGVNWQAEKPGGAFGVFRVGKSRAGRLLDGLEHNAMPEVHHG